jgi:hypothetical protein
MTQMDQGDRKIMMIRKRKRRSGVGKRRKKES